MVASGVEDAGKTAAGAKLGQGNHRKPSAVQNVLVIGMTDDMDRRMDDLRARLQELNGRLAVPQIEPNARAHMVQEIREVEAEIARLLDEQTRRFGGA
jgi:hypothetical protein